MISFSTNVQNALSQPSVETFYLVRIGSFYLTTFYRDISVGGQPYVADGSVIAVEPPQVSSTVDRQPFKIVFSDSLFERSSISNTGLIGTPVSVRVCFTDINTGLPYLDPADNILIYDGLVDATGYSIGVGAIGESTLNVTCTSPMSDLDATNTFYGSQDYMDKVYPGDTSFEQLFEGSGPIDIRWGKA